MGLYLARSAADFAGIKEEFRERMRRVEFIDKEYNKMAAVPETALERAAGRFLAGPIRQLTTDEDGQLHLARFWAAATLLILFFMLLPTMNLVNLNVSRIMERASEIGVRKAFGATARTLVGQFVVENVALTLVGGLLGFVLAYAVLGALTSSGLVPYAHFQMNVRVFLAGMALAVVFGVVSGTYPAWRMSRLHPVAALSGGAR